MARFRFKLDPLLRLRQRTEDERKRVVAGLQRERMGIEQQLRDMQAFITGGKHDQRDCLEGNVEIDALRAHAAMTMRHVRDAQRLAINLAGVHQRLEAARGELAEAARERRALEILKERRFDEWRRRLEKAEDASIDEVASRVAQDTE